MHSILRCGAANVLASFWQVTDRISGQFIKHYYEVCTDEGHASALAVVQRLAINNRIAVPEIEDTSHPYCWAGYTVHRRASSDIW